MKRVAQEKAQAARATVISDFKSMLREKGDITSNTRWSKVGFGVKLVTITCIL